MKSIFYLKPVTACFVLLFISAFSNSFSQQVWNEKNGVGWNQPASSVPMDRDAYTGFSVGGSVYFGTGYNELALGGWDGYGDLFRYNPATNLWIQKASISPRDGALGFAIGLKGYIGFGTYANDDNLNDLWEYDPTFDIWSQKADFPDTARKVEFSFAVNSKGYIGGGSVNDLWEFEPSANIWTFIDTLPFDGDDARVTFDVGTNAFVVGNNFNLKFDSQLMNWTPVTAMPVNGMYGAFVLQGNGYVITTNADMFAYDPVADQWTQKASPIPASGSTTGSDGTFGYKVGAGPVVRYDPVSNTWSEQIPSAGEFNHFYDGDLITLNNLVYTMASVYDPVADRWTHDSIIENDGWLFAINNFGYAMRGNSFEKYDPVSATWTPLNPPGIGIALTFGANGKGYSVLFRDSLGNYDSTLHEYDPVSDSWSVKAPYPGEQGEFTTAFSISGKGYLVGGVDASYNETPQFWEYDPVADSWTRKADYPGYQFPYFPFAEDYRGRGYVGLGGIQTVIADDKMYCYDPAADIWSQVQHPLGRRNGTISFVVNDSLYVGRGSSRQTTKFSYRYNDLWTMTDTLGTFEEEIVTPSQQVQIFPNPASQEIRISGAENAALEIFNQAGQSIMFMSKGEKVTRMNLFGFAAGIYFLKVIDGEKIFVKKFLVEE